jgi:hypothetical protein
VLAIGYLLTNMGIPCMYYGTEQGFDGGGRAMPTSARRCSAASGARSTRPAVHFFNPNHSIYQGIETIAKVRAEEPALRYGREYFREISGNGEDFGHPIDGNCTLAFARVLDTTSVVVAMNLTAMRREDHILVDANLNHQAASMVNLLEPSQRYTVHSERQRPNPRCRCRWRGGRWRSLKKVRVNCRPAENLAARHLPPARLPFRRVAGAA